MCKIKNTWRNNMNTVTELRNLNNDIKTQELALHTFMDMDLSITANRKDMRKVLNIIEELEVAKSNLLANA